MHNTIKTITSNSCRSCTIASLRGSAYFKFETLTILFARYKILLLTQTQHVSSWGTTNVIFYIKNKQITDNAHVDKVPIQ